MKTRKKAPLSVKVRLEPTQSGEIPEGRLYIYDQSGHLVLTENLPKTIKSELKLDLPEELRDLNLRVLIGPPLGLFLDHSAPPWLVALEKASGDLPENLSPEVLKSMGAVEKRVRPRHSDTVEIVAHPPDIAKWFTCSCLVRGRLVKRVPMPDGTTQLWGVCHACIKIYDVDPFPLAIAKIPDHELFRLRDDLIKILKKWPPVPPEEVLPPIPPRPPAFSQRERMSRTPDLNAGVDEVQADSVSHASGLESVLSLNSATQLRHAFMADSGLIKKLACYLPWFMSHYHKHLIACACTDELGQFEATINYPCAGDQPDLYFKASQCIGGSLHTLYDPGMVCHTWWNYPCGTEVLLETTDPAAKVCAPPEDITPPPGVMTWIAINRIGGIRINDIGSDGLVGYDFVGPEGHISATGAPFGQTLGFRVSHRDVIPNAAIKYYRWLYRRDDDAPNDWKEFASPFGPTVGRHYADYDLSHPLKPPTFPVYALGPKSVKSMNLYEFRPQLSTLESMAPANHKYEWPMEPIADDIYSSYLVTPSLPGGSETAFGKYWFKLEIFDASGDQVLPSNTTFRFIVITDEHFVGDTRLANITEINNGGFIFPLNIDNRPCQAVIDTPMITTPGSGTIGADPNCGFLRYADTDTIHLDFHALHPAERATFRFWIRRGANEIKDIHGEVAAAPVGEWNGDHHGNFAANFAPADLRGECPHAAFAEMLNVYAKATDGWDQIESYNAYDQWAFALSPKPPAP